jgi:hypothetical protein
MCKVIFFYINDSLHWTVGLTAISLKHGQFLSHSNQLFDSFIAETFFQMHYFNLGYISTIISKGDINILYSILINDNIRLFVLSDDPGTTLKTFKERQYKISRKYNTLLCKRKNTFCSIINQFCVLLATTYQFVKRVLNVCRDMYQI